MGWEDAGRTAMYWLPVIAGSGYLVYTGALRKRLILCYLVLAGPLFAVIAAGLFAAVDMSDVTIALCAVLVCGALLSINAGLGRALKQSARQRVTWREVVSIAFCSHILAACTGIAIAMIWSGLGHSL